MSTFSIRPALAARHLALTMLTCLAVTGCGGGGSSSSGADPGIAFTPLNDTGITYCGDAEDSVNTPCLGNEPPGQDADFGRDAEADLEKIGAGEAGFDYSRVCHNGDVEDQGACPPQPLRGDLDQHWGCTRDNVTGLLWELKDASTLSMRHVDHGYTWYNPSPSTLNPGEPGDTNSCDSSLNDQPCNVAAYIAAVNAAGLCGHNDWRLPSRQELESLVHYGREAPHQDTDLFPEIPAAALWAATRDAGSTDSAWTLDMGTALHATHTLDAPLAVRLVRGERIDPPDPVAQDHCAEGLQSSMPLRRYDNALAGTVVDLTTGLMWKQCVEGLSGQDCTDGTAQAQGWAATLDDAAVHSFAGFDDWRLPNVRELASLQDTCTRDPALSPLLFPAPALGNLWTASPAAPDMAWQVSAGDGRPVRATRDDMAGARLVRGGSPRLAPPRSDTLVLRAGAPDEQGPYEPGQLEPYTFTAQAVGPDSAIGAASITACHGAVADGLVTIEIEGTVLDCDNLPQSLPVPEGLVYNSDGAREHHWHGSWAPDASLLPSLGATEGDALDIQFTAAGEVALGSPPVRHEFKVYNINQPPWLTLSSSNPATCITGPYTVMSCEQEILTSAGIAGMSVGLHFHDVDMSTSSSSGAGVITDLELICLAESGCDPDGMIHLYIASTRGLNELEQYRRYRLAANAYRTDRALSVITVYTDVPGDYLLKIEVNDAGNSGACSYDDPGLCQRRAQTEQLLRVRHPDAD
ncbi:MAG: DUF1566 domain-containing protein [Alcanivorax sp.]|nr:DUF1566 domain-containing protein [Alcanivorax sp.]